MLLLPAVFFFISGHGPPGPPRNQDHTRTWSQLRKNPFPDSASAVLRRLLLLTTWVKLGRRVPDGRDLFRQGAPREATRRLRAEFRVRFPADIYNRIAHTGCSNQARYPIPLQYRCTTEVMRSLVAVLADRHIRWDDKERLFEAVLGAILLWLFPDRCQSARTHRPMRLLCAFLTFLLGLMDAFALRSDSVRFIIRALPPHLQRYFWLRQPTTQDHMQVREYFQEVVAALWNPHNTHHWVYAKWIQRHRYWGEAQPVREKQGQPIAGAVDRELDHFEGMLCTNHRERERPRYIAWRNYFPQMVRTLYVFWGTTPLAEAYETFLIRHDDTRLQGTSRRDRDRAAMRGRRREYRPFPRFRAALSARREMECNLYQRWVRSRAVAHIQTVAAGLHRARLMSLTFVAYVRQALACGIFAASQSYLYCVALAPTLVAILAQPRQLVDWASLTSGGTPSCTLHVLRMQAAAYPEDNGRTAVTRKLDYCIKWWVHVRNPQHWFRIPSPSAISPARFLNWLRETLRPTTRLATMRNHYLNEARIEYLLSRTHACSVPHTKIGELHTNHIRFCRQFRKDTIALLQHTVPVTRDIPDVNTFRFRDAYWDVKHLPSTPELVENLTQQVVAWAYRVRIVCRPAAIQRDIERLCARQDILAIPSRAHHMYVLTQLQPAAEDVILGLPDKDNKRRWELTAAGYSFICIRTLQMDASFQLRLDMDLDSWALLKYWHTQRLLPARFQPTAPYTAREIPYLYYNCKPKCFADGQHVCPKAPQHQCARPVCSQCVLPKPVQRGKTQAAIVIRTCMHHYRADLYQLWILAEIRTALDSAVRQLMHCAAFAERCPCGRKKDHALSLAQLDASGFFSNSDNRRGLARFQSTHESITAAHGYTGVAITRGRSLGYFIRGNPPQNRSGVQTMTFQEAQIILRQEAEDGVCALGEAAVWRSNGWFMGGILSECATGVDLGTSEREFLGDPAIQRQTGFTMGNIPIRALVQGLRHVDNVLLMSLVWCAHCLIEKGKRIYPSDVQMEEESIAQPMQFLTTAVGARGRDLLLRPWNVNRAYAVLATDRAKELRLGPELEYFGSKITLRQFLFSKVAAFRQVSRDHVEIGWAAMIELMFEALRLDYSVCTLERALRPFAGTRSSPLVDAARRWLRDRKRDWPHQARGPTPMWLLQHWIPKGRPIPPFPLQHCDNQRVRLAART